MMLPIYPPNFPQCYALETSVAPGAILNVRVLIVSGDVDAYSLVITRLDDTVVAEIPAQPIVPAPGSPEKLTERSYQLPFADVWTHLQVQIPATMASGVYYARVRRNAGATTPEAIAANSGRISVGRVTRIFDTFTPKAASAPGGTSMAMRASLLCSSIVRRRFQPPLWMRRSAR